MNSKPRIVEVRQNVLRQNDLAARELRVRFREAGVFVVSLVSSPGSGKTAFLEKTLAMMRAANGAWPRWWGTWPRRTTPNASRAAELPCGRS